MKLTRKNSKKLNRKSYTLKNRKFKRKSNNKSNITKDKKRNTIKNNNKKGGGTDTKKLQERIKELKNDLNMERSINSKIKADMDKIVPAMTELKKQIVFQYNSFVELNELVGSIFGKKEI